MEFRKCKHFDSIVMCYQVLLYEEIQTYKKTKKLEKRKYLAKEIYNTYLARDSTFEVNLTTHECVLVKSKIDNNEFTPDLFEDILVAVRLNLMDTFSRFARTEEFITYQNNVELQEGLFKHAKIK